MWPELERLRAASAPGSSRAFGLTARLAEGGVVTLAGGTHVAAVTLEKSVTLKGEKGTRPVLVGTRESSALATLADRLDLVLENLVITGAGGDHGAIAALGTLGKVTLRDCVIFDNVQNERGPAAGGLSIRSGTAVLERCIFFSNSGQTGGAVAVRGDAQLEARSCLFVANRSTRGGAGVWVEDGASAKLVNCTFAGNEVSDVLGGHAVHATGTSGRQGTAELVNCVVLAAARPELVTFGWAIPPYSGKISVKSSILPEDARQYQLATFDSSTTFGAPALATEGFPFAPAKGKPGSEDGDAMPFASPDDAVDAFGASLLTGGFKVARGAVAPR